jgi:hypothetical protein
MTSHWPRYLLDGVTAVDADHGEFGVCLTSPVAPTEPEPVIASTKD